MQLETIAVHGGYTPDPTTKSAAVPLYQTVAYAFDSAQHLSLIHSYVCIRDRPRTIANPRLPTPPGHFPIIPPLRGALQPAGFTQ